MPDVVVTLSLKASLSSDNSSMDRADRGSHSSFWEGGIFPGDPAGLHVWRIQFPIVVLLTKLLLMQPIAAEGFPKSTTGLSRHVELVQAAFGNALGSQDMTAVSRRQTVERLAAKQSDELMDDIYTAFMQYSDKYKLTVIAGSHAGA